MGNIFPRYKINFQLTHEKINPDTANLYYKVYLTTDSGKFEVIEKSPLGIERKDAAFSNNLSYFSETKITEFNDSYNLLTGKVNRIDKTGNTVSVTFQNPKNQLADFQPAMVRPELT